MRLLRSVLLPCIVGSAISASAQSPGVKSSVAPIAPFRLVTAELPPFAIEKQQAAPGFAVELVQAMAARLGQPVRVEFFPWARAYALAQADPRVAVIPLTRTPDRDTHFQWLVKLFQQQYRFVTKVGGKHVNTVEDARSLKRIGVLRSSLTMEYALREHFPAKNLVQEVSVEAGLKDLDAGVIDTYYGGYVISSGTITATGRNLSDYHFGATMGGGEIWLGASSGFSDAEIAALRQAFDALNADGTYASLLKKYDILN